MNLKYLIPAILLACTDPQSPPQFATRDVSPVTQITGPTEQSLTLPTGFDHGEINMETIQGEAVCWPGDTFGHVIRMEMDDHCDPGHSQRVGALAMETHLNNVNGVERTAVGGECDATGGTFNNCFEALHGDIVVHHGDITVDDGDVFSAGYVAALGTVYAEGPGGISLYRPDIYASIRVSTTPPTDFPHIGSLVIDTGTPAVWFYDGATWRQLATVPSGL